MPTHVEADLPAGNVTLRGTVIDAFGGRGCAFARVNVRRAVTDSAALQAIVLESFALGQGSLQSVALQVS